MMSADLVAGLIPHEVSGPILKVVNLLYLVFQYEHIIPVLQYYTVTCIHEHAW